MATATIELSAQVQDNKALDLGTYIGNPQIAKTITLSSSDITKVFGDSRASAVAVPLDVTSGLVDAFGLSLVYTTVKAVVVLNTHATASITVGGGSNPLFGSDQYTVPSGQVLYVPNVPITVSGTVKVLTITPAASATYNVLILGS